MVTLELQGGVYITTIDGDDVASITRVGASVVAELLRGLLEHVRQTATGVTRARVTTAYENLDATTKAEVDRLLGIAADVRLRRVNV